MADEVADEGGQAADRVCRPEPRGLQANYRVTVTTDRIRTASSPGGRRYSMTSMEARFRVSTVGPTETTKSVARRLARRSTKHGRRRRYLSNSDDDERCARSKYKIKYILV